MTFCQVFFVLFATLAATPMVHADGEEAFVGVIQGIATGKMTINITDPGDSSRSLGKEIDVLITRNTIVRDASLETISFRRLSVGTAVRIQPNTLSNNDIEASIVIVDKRR